MPTLDNPRHERFAQGLAKGMSADAAYEQAGFKPNRGNASTLKANQSVKDRVAELQERAEAKTEITLQKLIEYANEARELAVELKQPGAAVQAIKELGVLTGNRVERRENTNRTVSDLTDDELAHIACGGSASAFDAPHGTSKPH